ncbi:hypothetical protein POM88_014443 [Heracleum sosnowskyi]|uniref:Uncharacterized protein n=1 Tax=Heracleum sosnowskyi TaxID=360622 RepID=A0AAD8N464_9APIA|nr:hypothetical protein POM88_014443 [Heracleum sosnowskyi]
MASAGYDPQAAPKVYEIFENKSSPGSDFCDMHPSGKKREPRNWPEEKTHIVFAPSHFDKIVGDFFLHQKLQLNQPPFAIRQESEADHIGLLVMASARYDPQAAPKVYEIFEKNESSETGIYDKCTSAKKRAEKLASGEVMKRSKFNILESY